MALMTDYFKPLVFKLFDIYCLSNDLDRKMAAKKFGVSWAFLWSVLSYKRHCPVRIRKKLSELLGKDEELINLMFGVYSSDWVRMCREHPVKVSKIIRTLIETTYPKPEISS